MAERSDLDNIKILMDGLETQDCHRNENLSVVSLCHKREGQTDSCRCPRCELTRALTNVLNPPLYSDYF
jgi:hypothetical protein